MTNKSTKLWERSEKRNEEILNKLIQYPDLIKLHKQYVEIKFGRQPEQLDRKEALLGIVGELGEIVLNSDFLSWKTRNDKDNIIEEITDILFFVLELYLIYGVESFSEVAELYLEKRERNLAREDHRKW